MGEGGIGLQIIRCIEVRCWNQVSFVVLPILAAVAAIGTVPARVRAQPIGLGAPTGLDAAGQDAWNGHMSPTPDTWRILLPAALRIVRSLRDNGYGPLDFRLGGGTVLMLRWGHRVSKDIDLFIHDGQALAYLLQS